MAHVGIKRSSTDEIHIHKLVQIRETSYKAVRKKYGDRINENGMIKVKDLKL